MDKKTLLVSSLGIILSVITIILGKSGIIKDASVIVKRNNLVIEVYSKVKLSDLITLKEGTTLIDKEIDTSEIGKKNITFSYKNKLGQVKNDTFQLTIVDKTPPIMWISDTYTIVRGNNIDIEENIFCADNYDKKPNCKVIGEYNSDEVGEYKLTYLVEDKSKNTLKKEFTLQVIEESPNYSSSKVTLSDVRANYLTANSIIGIDVSKWQGDIEWKKVKDSGVEFVMIRLGTQIGPGKESNIDRYFSKNIKEAKEVGLDVGVYYFSYASTVKEAKAQAKWVIEMLDGYTLDLPVVFDWECYDSFDDFELNLHELNEISNSFLESIKEAGYIPMHYASKNYLEKVWTEIDSNIWLAHYTNKTNYQGKYQMWQLTNKGTIPGIKGDVDIDILYFEK